MSNKFTSVELEQLKRDYKINKGDKIYTVLKQVSSSGMSRQIMALHIHHETNEIINISRFIVARVLGWRMNKSQDAIVTSGCGMDMGFHLVYEFSYAWFKAERDKDEEFNSRKDAGYWLKQNWL